MSDWQTGTGIQFLRKVGLRKGDKLLDFGCRVGRYAIPAAFVVGKRGKVYAVDKDAEPLRELETNAGRLGLTNVRIIPTDGRAEVPLPADSVNGVLLYDVLHYFNPQQRHLLYKECLRVLDKRGFLSVYPKHTMEDDPNREFEGIYLADIMEEIKGCKFDFVGKLCGKLSHDDNITHGCVMNFTK